MSVPLVLSEEQAEYIRVHIGHPILPNGKDLEMVSTIKDLIASAKEQAKYKDNVKQKAHANLETLAKFIIARQIKNRVSFSSQETRNIMRRVIKCKITEHELIDERYWRIIITHPELRGQRFVVRYNQYSTIVQVWESKEGIPFPWNPIWTEVREPLLEFDSYMLEDLTEEWKDA